MGKLGSLMVVAVRVAVLVSPVLPVDGVTTGVNDNGVYEILCLVRGLHISDPYDIDLGGCSGGR